MGAFLRNNGATRAVASTLGVLVGLAGIEHGFFEVLQGNVSPSEVMIEAIGPAQRFWEYGTERALTIVPNFFVTGILAMIVGILVTVWAAAFIDRKHGAAVLLLLSVTLWLVGGGFAPIFMSLLAAATATRINKPLNWWRKHLSVNLRGFLAKLWLWSIISFVVVFVVGVEIAIFGYPLLWLLDASTTYSIQNILAFIMVALMPVSIITAFAHDIQKQTH
jgi:MFS family permease